MAQASALFAGATLFTIMVDLGLGLPVDTLTQLRRRPALVGRVLLGSCLLVPLAALLLLKLPFSQALSPAARLAIALMVVSPSAPLTLRKAGKQGCDRQLAALLQASAAVAAIASIPLMADALRSAFGLSGWDIGPLEVALQVGRVQLLPLAAGMLLRHGQPQLAERIEAPLNRLANSLFLVLLLLVLVRTGPLLLPFVSRERLALAVMAVLVLATLAIGLLMAGPRAEPQERTTVALVTSMRNPGLALLFAATHAAGQPGVKIAVLAYLLVTVVLSLPFLRWQKRQEAKAEAATRLPLAAE
ncbi:MAG: transporter [Synechococcus sp.]